MSQEEINTEDTVQLAWKIKASQGSHEAEVSCGAEADLHNQFTNCPKNPGHVDFVAVTKFDLHNLPSKFRNQAVLKCIKCLAQITVRVDTRRTRQARPDYYRNSEEPFPFAEHKGTDMTRYGTGWVRHVQILRGPCPCYSCQNTGQAHPTYAKLVIRTAAHVVYDAEEGKKCTCSFYYDEDGRPEFLPGVVSISSSVDVVSEVDGDFSDMTFVTHDLDFAKDVERGLEDYVKLHGSVWDMYPANAFPDVDQGTEDLNLAVIVSHPHGAHKHVSVGYYKRRCETESTRKFTLYTYSTATCTGSSGAPVFILGKSRRWPWCSHPHSGSAQESTDQNTGFNYSGIDSNTDHVTRSLQSIHCFKTNGVVVTLTIWPQQGSERKSSAPYRPQQGLFSLVAALTVIIQP